MLPSVPAGGHNSLRGRRLRRAAWTAGVTVVAVALVALGVAAVRTRGGLDRTAVSVAAPPPPTTLVIPAAEGRHEVRVPSPLPQVPAEAPVWTDVPPDVAFVNQIATALGAGGTAARTASGFVVNDGNANLRVAPANGGPGWRLEMDQCPIGLCRPPDVSPTVPVPTVEIRDAPDHPPFDAAPVVADAGRRLATVVGGVTVPHMQMSLGEWWAELEFTAAGVVAAGSGFRAHITPDGSVRLAEGFVDRPGRPGPARPLIGIDEGLRRLALATPLESFGAVLCTPQPCAERPLVVTGVRLGWQLADQGFTPAYVFTLADGGERYVAAL